VKTTIAGILFFSCAFAAGVGSQSATGTGRLVYIGTYTGETSKGIYAFRFDDKTGALTPAGLVAETPSPSFLTAAANGRFVYAVNELQTFGGEASGSVTAFAADPATGTLTELNTQPTKGAGPCHLALDRTGRYLAVANYSGGNFALFPVGTDGRLEPASAVVAGEATEPGPSGKIVRLGHSVGFDATNKYMIAADKGLSRMLVWAFDAAKGTLTPHGSAALAPGSGARHYAFDPKGRWLFTITEQGATIDTLAWDQKAGTLTPRSSVSTRPAGVTKGSTAEIAVHQNGRFVYGSNRGDDSIAVFSVGANGALTLVEHESTRGQTPRNFALDPTGKWLIAANQRSNTLAVFSIDQSTGALSPVGPLSNVGAPVCVLFAPAGE
jgi:6-phosphogluconolactonase